MFQNNIKNIKIDLNKYFKIKILMNNINKIRMFFENYGRTFTGFSLIGGSTVTSVWKGFSTYYTMRENINQIGEKMDNFEKRMDKRIETIEKTMSDNNTLIHNYLRHTDLRNENNMREIRNLLKKD